MARLTDGLRPGSYRIEGDHRLGRQALHLEVTVDLTRFTEAMTNLRAAMRKAAATHAAAADSMTAWIRAMEERRGLREEVYQAGQEARWYVRGGLCRTEEELAEMVWPLLRGLLEERAYAVAAMAGYAVHAREELACAECQGTGELRDAHRPAWPAICGACDGTGRWDPESAKGVTAWHGVHPILARWRWMADPFTIPGRRG